jgi:4-amino-4-deoxy-L-arabinose transferase-like glycosyltransferase
MMAQMTANNNSEYAMKLPPLFKWAWILLLIIASANIWLAHGKFFYYHPDEAMHSSIAAGSGLLEVLRFSRYEIHPPLSYIPLHYWMLISQDPTWVRMLSFLFSMALLPLYYFIGKRMAGELAGLWCATFVAFSTGIISQSFVVRQYPLFMLLISLSFYYYAVWRDTRTRSALSRYTLTGVLAALTHFSAIFFYFCLALYEALVILSRKEKRRALMEWLFANLSIAAVALLTYLAWQPTLNSLSSFFAEFVTPPGVRAAGAAIYPLSTTGFLYPSYGIAIPMLYMLLAYGLWRKPSLPGWEKLRGFVLLAGLSLTVGAGLFYFQIYPFLGTRHSLWIFPLIIPITGAVVAEITAYISRRLNPDAPIAAPMMVYISLILLATWSALAHSDARFGKTGEYGWPLTLWQDLTSKLETLGPTDLIITEKDDGIMLANLYRYMGDDAFYGSRMATLVPYHNTHVLFNPRYPRNYSTDVMLATLEQAKREHMFDGIKRFVFLQMQGSRAPLTELMLCPALKKEIILYPPEPPDHKFVREDFYVHRATLMLISKQAFLNDVLSPSGGNHNCFDRSHDMVPGFMPARQ